MCATERIHPAGRARRSRSGHDRSRPRPLADGRSSADPSRPWAAAAATRSAPTCRLSKTRHPRHPQIIKPQTGSTWETRPAAEPPCRPSSASLGVSLTTSWTGRKSPGDSWQRTSGLLSVKRLCTPFASRDCSVSFSQVRRDGVAKIALDADGELTYAQARSQHPGTARRGGGPSSRLTTCRTRSAPTSRPEVGARPRPTASSENERRWGWLSTVGVARPFCLPTFACGRNGPVTRRVGRLRVPRGKDRR
jgi:hypothetical protein